MKSESKVSSKLELRELVLLAMVIAIKVVLGQFKVGDATLQVGLRLLAVCEVAGRLDDDIGTHLAHGILAGSRSEKTRMLWSPTLMVSPSTETPSRWPEIESHSSRVASVFASGRSLTATTSTSAELASAALR